MKLQNVCAITGTAICALSWLFGDNVLGRLGDKNMQKIAFAITMGIASYFVLLTASTTIQFFLERRDKKRAEEKEQSELDDDVSRLKPIHLEMLRILLDERTLVLNDDFRNSVDYLVYNGFVGRISPDKITFTKKGKEVAMKLEKEGRL